jgi:hypothetical protein
MKKKANVHRLPTEESRLLRDDDGRMYYYHKNQTGGGIITAFHLYITTDEEIKEGDWVHHKEYGIRHYVNKDLTPEAYKSKGWKKIIATTDSNLFVTIGEYYNAYNKELPQIPQSFIEEYCKAGGIDDVLVEYVLNPTRHTHLKPRTINNTIIIHPVEEKMYSREDIMNALHKAELKDNKNYSKIWKGIEENL